jgi:hypothetical protein
MLRIEHFGHVLEIAFSVSAIFYYFELRELAEDRLRRAIDAYQSAVALATEQFKGTIPEGVRASAKNPYGGLLAIRRDPLWLQREKAQIQARGDKALTSSLIDSSVLMILRWTPYLTSTLVVISTTCSLGALIYSGFNPDLEIGWKLMTLVLVLSYSSISWNLIFYVLLLPLLLKGRPTLQSRDKILGAANLTGV